MHLFYPGIYNVDSSNVSRKALYEQDMKAIRQYWLRGPGEMDWFQTMEILIAGLLKAKEERRRGCS